MKSWKKFLHQSEAYRRLRPSQAGYWYILLTIGLGVAALSTRNNILYLIDSLLLSGMIFSGILSERAISAVECKLYLSRAVASSPTQDILRIKNLKGFPIFCLEIEEWRESESTPLGFIPFLGAHEEKTISTSRTFIRRGIHSWEGLAISTSYPFGFAKKTRLELRTSERVIWPAPHKNALRELNSIGTKQMKGEELTEGELRPFTPDDDFRMIVWTASTKGSPMVRPRRSPTHLAEVFFNLKKISEADFEREISIAAAHYLTTSADTAPPLIILNEQGTRKKILGRVRALDTLATLNPAGRKTE